MDWMNFLPVRNILTPMTNEEYLQKLLNEIAEAKALKRKGIYRMDEKVSDKTVKYLREYFAPLYPQYLFETHKCARCKHSWDIIILFGT